MRAHVAVGAGAALIALTVLFLTATDFSGDAPFYARDVAAARSGGVAGLIEPGHLLWRPLGAVVSAGSLSRAGGDPAVRERTVQRALTHASEIAAVVAVVAIALLTHVLFGSVPFALLVAAALSLSSAFANFSHAGAAYVPGLAALCVSLALGWAPWHPWSRSTAAASGLFLALAAMFWLPYVLVAPAALAGMALLRPAGQRRHSAVIAGVACAGLGVLSFGVAAVMAGVRSPGQLVGWIGASSHGLLMPGISRAAVGFVRTYLHIGADARDVKRFLLGDPYHPITRRDLLGLWLWPKAVLLYGGLSVAAAIDLTTSLGRRFLLLLVMAGIPVMWLAIRWSGGESERYLPLDPFILLVFATALHTTWQAHRRLTLAAGVILLAALLSNAWALRASASVDRARAQLTRLGCLAPTLDARSLILLPHQADPLMAVYRDRIDDVPRSSGARVLPLLPRGPWHHKAWGDELAVSIAEARAGGIRVFVPAYVREDSPPAWADWVEGEDVPWSHVRDAFAELATRQPCAGTDFVEVVGNGSPPPPGVADPGTHP
jgi:hypothetical protein